MNLTSGLPVERFLQTLEIVAREGKQLSYSWKSLFAQAIDAGWVDRLEHNPGCAEQLEAFVSRFGRMQDTMAAKLFPRWLLALAETPGSQIETLNRAERLGVLTSMERWLEARNLCNRLMTDPVMFVETFNCLRQDAMTRMGHEKERLPEELPLPG